MIQKNIGGAVVAAILFALPVLPAYAQEAPAAAPPAGTARAQDAPATIAKDGLLTLATVLADISKTSGILVVADSSVAQNKVVPPTEPITAENMDVQLAAIIRKLPRGTTFAKLFLPEKPGGYRGDDLVDYALAQARLFGNVGGLSDATSIEVMGKKVTGERANVVSDALSLKPVYLVANPNLRVAKADAATDWSQMTPEQRQKYAQDQARTLLSQNPQQQMQSIQQMFQQQGAVMGALMQSMSPQQRQQFFQNMQGAMGGMRGMMPGGGGMNGGGRRGGRGNGGG